MRPDRIVGGAYDDRATSLMRTLDAPFQRNHERFIIMDVRSAELAKHAANALLATWISFMKELANLAESLGADIESVCQGIGSDPRIGYHFLYPRCGCGGSCFLKDVKALINTAAGHGHDLKVLNAVEAADNLQKHVLTQKVKARFDKEFTGKHFAIWGLALNPNTDDMREAPSCEPIDDLLTAGATVTAFDPEAMHETCRVYASETRLTLADTPINALNKVQPAEALLIVTEWKVFRSPDFDDTKSKLKTPVIIDGRNLYQVNEVTLHGLEYYPIGRKQSEYSLGIPS
jgi:UDPglucose 6-dehydrogenase